MMSNNPEEGVQNYVNSPNFLQYSQKKDLEPKEDDFFARIKLKKKEEDRKNDNTNGLFPTKKTSYN